MILNYSTPRLFTPCRSENYFASMKYSFFLKKDHKNKDGKYPLYLNLYIHKQRKRIPVELYIKNRDWSQTKQEVLKTCDQYHDFNLILRDIEAKINKIEIQYRLTNEPLTVDKCAELLRRPDLTVDFISFMEYEMRLKNMEENSLKNHCSVLKKLKEYTATLLFADVNETFISKYRKYLSAKLKNQSVTIDSNIKVIKHYIKLAKKRGVMINVDLERIKIKQHRSHRTNLSLQEVERMKEYYFSKFIKPTHKMVLGYFLFNCMTGLRINDLLKLKREQLNDDYFYFWNQKSKKQQILMTNETCRKILAEDSSLFIKPPSAKHINEVIKEIALFLGIKKHLVCHVARHTFATNYLRKGGKVEDLQILLGHSDIKTTMIYVHIVESEAINTMRLLD
uniref:tyrosine-type recombinase/integrase n=2 Tax=Riemerella anatipestifer TaxID=34085 RepID=UPI0030ED3F7B